MCTLVVRLVQPTGRTVTGDRSTIGRSTAMSSVQKGHVAPEIPTPGTRFCIAVGLGFGVGSCVEFSEVCCLRGCFEFLVLVHRSIETHLARCLDLESWVAVDSASVTAMTAGSQPPNRSICRRWSRLCTPVAGSFKANLSFS